jgi:hypothetical protein
MDTSSATQALQTYGLSAFGIGMPQLAQDWVPGGVTASYSVPDSTDTTDDPFKITQGGGNWGAPLTAAFLVIDTTKGQTLPVTLLGFDGTAQNQSGLLLTVIEAVWLRLNWLYAQALETAPSGNTRPERALGLPYRQVPRYFFYPSVTTNTLTEGLAEAGADLGVTGDLYIYDNDGLPIDPIAVMSAFNALMIKFQLLQTGTATSTPALGTGVTSLLTTADVQLRLVNPDGTPYTDTGLVNVTPLTGGQVAGLNTITTAGTAVTVQPVSSTFSQDDHDRMVFGPANGRMSDTFTPPTLPNGITLQRDFYTLRVVDLTQYLIGSVPDADPSSLCQPAPDVRVHEQITLLNNGNDVMGAVGSTLTATANPALAVAQQLINTFALPTTAGTQAQWPVFPNNAPAVATPALSITLPAALTITAAWFNTAATDYTKVDVVVTISGFPTAATATMSSLVGAWIRLYTRLFGLDAVQQRGDGQGRAVPATGTISIHLTDPLGLKNIPNPGQPASAISIPPNATLNFDMIVVLPGPAPQTARIYGGLSTNITAGPAPAITPAFAPGTNTSTANATLGGVSNSGILGLGKPPSFTPPSSVTGWLDALTGDGNPRDAPRLPTMARRELLVAGQISSAWTGVIGGGRLAPEAVCALPRLGEPGGYGGRETIVTGAMSSGGRIAYDIARHALRRAQSIIDRLPTLGENAWALPAEPAVVAAGAQPSGASGTFAGAVLQNISPFCESPELYPLLSSNPSTINDFVQGLVGSASSLPSTLGIQSDVVNALDSLMTPPPAGTTTPSNAALQVAQEIIRECATSAFGRRDTQWALESALAQARHFVYIETPGFCSTADDSVTPLPSYAVDLIAVLNQRMQKMPGLCTMVCVPKYPDFATGFEGMAAYEVLDRYNILVGQPSAHPIITNQLPTAQTVGFHPIGFPGRYSRIESTVIIIDDIWAIVGGSTFRRRGLTFDGSSDLVFTDTQLVNGRSTTIRDFRRALMAQRLGITADPNQPAYVQLNDGQRSFQLIRQTLIAGGLGNVDLWWNGLTPNVTPTPPLTLDQANPEGRTFNFAQAAIISAFAASVSGW